ncbi:hypothetical protein BaRGS_00006405 [Batillaria attramentaria]|uniref:BZIP domain-containing protein n=1 Tax=Batillaria attramentaria TaxID=370345 RepID=A0ABD0LU33_9CAEN
MASVQPMSEDLDLLTIEHTDLSSFQPMMGHLSGIREVATEQQPDDAGQEMASSQSSSDDQSPCEDNQMTDAEKKRERRKKQKRDYATRKRVKDKKKTEALEKKRTSLLSQREQSEREIHKLKALQAYCPAYDAEMIDFLNLDLTPLPNIAHMLEDGKKGVPGEDYSNFPDDISSLDCTNRAPLPAVYPDCTEPVTISPQNSPPFWIDTQSS